MKSVNFNKKPNNNIPRSSSKNYNISYLIKYRKKTKKSKIKNLFMKNIINWINNMEPLTTLLIKAINLKTELFQKNKKLINTKR